MLLRSRGDLLLHFATEHQFRTAVDSGNLRRVLPGWYVPEEQWSGRHAEDRLLLRVLAVARTARTDPLFSHASAAAIWGLPLYGLPNRRVQVTVPSSSRASSTRTVQRHVTDLPPGSATRVAGIRCTSLQRTAIDLARTEAPEVSFAAADSALRLALPRSARGTTWTEERARWLANVDNLAPVPGKARARRLLAHIDPRSESPLESLSRLHLLKMGFRVQLQVGVPAPRGGPYRVDLELLDQQTLVEVDGRAKYQGNGEAHGEAIFYAEKQRHDWITGTTGKRLIRWGAADVRSTRHLAERLRAFGITIPRPPW